MVEAVYRVDWTERERGWGPKPYGHTDYESLAEAKKAIEKHWDDYPDGPAPDYYISPGEPYLVEVEEEQKDINA